VNCRSSTVDSLSAVCFNTVMGRRADETDDVMTTPAVPTALQLMQLNSLPGLIQTEIEHLILRGELTVGERINESLLALRFGTSRGPVREALRALEECRLVRSEKNRGVFVREISVAEADEIYDIREVLDELIGRRLAQRATPPQIEELKALLLEMDEATTKQDVNRYHALNLEFHDKLVDMAGNDRLSEVYRALTKELLLFRLRGLQNGGGFAVSNTEHKAVIMAIASGDPERAGGQLRAHAASSRARMHKAVGVAGNTAGGTTVADSGRAPVIETDHGR
jgi:phosphonate utilization transcriptional regulator